MTEQRKCNSQSDDKGSRQQQCGTQLEHIVKGKKVKLWRAGVEECVEVMVPGEFGEKDGNNVGLMTLHNVVRLTTHKNHSHHLLLLAERSAVTLYPT